MRAPRLKHCIDLCSFSTSWFLQFLDFGDFCSFSTVTNCIEIVWRTSRHASIRLLLGTHANWSRGHVSHWLFWKRLHSQSCVARYSRSKAIEEKMLLSMCFHQFVGKRKCSSYCNEGVTLCRRYSYSVCKNVKPNIARPRERATKNVW